MAINDFNVSYPDFELGQIINPDEFDVNFADLMIRINQIIDVLNQITDGIGGNGSDIIDIGDVASFTSPKLQGFLEELVAQLQSKESGSGAEFIGSLPINGLIGNTVHEQLMSLSTALTELSIELEDEVTRLDEANTVQDATMTNILARLGVVEGGIESKADKTNVYTKAETDSSIASLQDEIEATHYDMDESNILLASKVTVGDNHVGKWQGINLEDLFNVIGATGLAIDTVTPTDPYEGLLWYNPTRGQYLLYTGGRWRVNGTPMQIVEEHRRVTIDTTTNTVDIGIPAFDPRYDAVIVHQNSVYIAKGHEYNLSADGTQIIHPDGTWDVGTTFDFTAFISTPVTE